MPVRTTAILAVSAAVLSWAVALSVIDIRRRRLPNMLTLGGAAAVLLGAAAAGRGPGALLGGLALGGLYLAVHLAAPAGLGAGDVKLALALGALTGALGAAVWTLAALGAALLTAVASLTVMAAGRGRSVPHGPAMCAASLGVAALALF